MRFAVGKYLEWKLISKNAYNKNQVFIVHRAAAPFIFTLICCSTNASSMQVQAWTTVLVCDPLRQKTTVHCTVLYCVHEEC